MPSMKLQTTLTGFTAFTVARLAELKDKTHAEIASYLLERWIDDNRDFLSNYEITVDKFDLDRRGGKVVQLDQSNDG